MSVNDETDRLNELEELQRLRILKTRVTDVVTNWVDRGTALHTSFAAAEDKADIVALRNQLDAEISAILGV